MTIIDRKGIPKISFSRVETTKGLILQPCCHDPATDSARALMEEILRPVAEEFAGRRMTAETEFDMQMYTELLLVIPVLEGRLVRVGEIWEAR